MSIFVLTLATGVLATAMGPTTEDPGTFYSFKMKNIDGQPVKLSHFKGKVLLVVNVASRCGFTPQYAGLEKVFQEYHGRGFEVLGFPANNFGGQEPGSDPEIKQFCTGNYNVTFPMFSKISVKGDDEHPLYRWLISQSDRPNDDIEWNFSKFVIDKHGKVVARFKSASTPESPNLSAGK